MATFSISDAAFSGFRIIRNKPVILVFWPLAQIVFGAVTLGMLLLVAGPMMAQMQSQLQGAQPDPAQSMRALQSIAPYDLMMLPVSLGYYGVLYAAINRAVLRPADSAFGYLRLGADELRQAGVLALIWLLLFVLYIAVIILAVIVGVAMVAIGGRNPAFGGLGMFAAFLIVPSTLIFVATKLSLASPQTFATGKIDVFGSWTLTRGRFWRVFGTYFVAFCMLFIIGLVFLLVVGSLLAAFGVVAQIAAAAKSNFAGSSIIPLVIGYVLIFNLFFIIVLPIWLAPPAAIYKSLTAGRETKEVEAVFA